MSATPSRLFCIELFVICALANGVAAGTVVAQDTRSKKPSPGNDAATEPGAASPVPSPSIVIVSDAAGLSAEEVESMITHPIEVAINALPQVKGLCSASSMGRSVVWVRVEKGLDIYAQRQRVTERLQLVRDQLPEKTQPRMLPQVGEGGPLMLVAVRASVASAKAEEQAADAVKLRAVGELILRPRLSAIPGVANVTLTGGRRQQYQVIVSPERLTKMDFGLGDVVTAVKKATAAGIGIGTRASGEPSVQTVIKPATADDIARSVMAVRDGVPVLIKDVADVRLSAAMADSEASVWINEQQKTRGGPAVILAVYRQPDANSKSLEDRLARIIDETQAALPPDVQVVQESIREDDICISSRGLDRDFEKKVAMDERIEKMLVRTPRVAAIWHTTGPAEIGGDDQVGDESVFRIRLKSAEGESKRRRNDEVVKEMRRQLSEVPGVRATIGRLASSPHGSLRIEGDYAVKVLGDDLETLRKLAEQIQLELSRISGVVELQILPGDREHLRLEIDREAAARLGIGLDDVAEIIQASGRGRSVGHIREAGRRIELVVSYGQPPGSLPLAMDKTLLRSATGERVPLSRLVRASMTTSPAVIYREELRRCAVLSYNIGGPSKAEVQKQANKGIDAVKDKLPKGYLLSTDQALR